MRNRYDVIVVMEPPGTDKSFLGNQPNVRGVASYQELEPLLRTEAGVAMGL